MLRVGILSKYEPDSDAIQSVIQEYLLHFDVVISGDDPMDLVNEIVKEVLSQLKHACLVVGIINNSAASCTFFVYVFKDFYLYLFLCAWHQRKAGTCFA